MESDIWLKRLGVIFIFTVLGLAYLAYLKGHSDFLLSFSLLTGRDVIFSLLFGTFWGLVFSGLINKTS